MVRVAVLPLAVMAALIPFTVADNCRNGLNYCGYGLLRKGAFKNSGIIILIILILTLLYRKL